MRGEPSEFVSRLPRPGRALKAVLILLGSLSLLGAIVLNWMPGGERGAEILSWLAFQPLEFHPAVLKAGGFPRVWTLLTSGLVTADLSHTIWSLVGLYFLTPDLERRWGGARLIRFLLLGVFFGNLAVYAGTFLGVPKLTPAFALGPLAAITATAIAWAKDHSGSQIRFMFFLPMSGKTLYWVTIGGALLALLFLSGSPEGALAPLGGVAAGLLFAGSPSPMRSLWLRIRLRGMRARGGGITVEQLLDDEPIRPRPSARRAGKSPLRVVPGGLEDDLKNRKPPKDKRYLN